MFGVKASEVIGKTLAELLGPQLFALNEPYVRAAFRGETQRFERVVPHANGSRRYGLAHYIPDIQHGQVVGLTCPGRCKSEPPYRPNSEPGMEAAGAGLRAVDEFSLRV